MYISVVVPFHGAEPFIAQCIDSLFVQRYPSWRRELIFVDDGGVAEARAVIERHLSVHLLDAPGGGGFAARNAGAAVARGEIIAFTNADCAVAPDWLESIGQAMADSGVKVVLGGYRPARAAFAASALAAYENEKNRYIIESPADRRNGAFTDNMAVRAELFAELGPFSPRRPAPDTGFLRDVITRYGPDAVRLIPSMAVRRSGIRGAFDHCRRAFASGRSRATRVPGPLSVRERLLVFSRTVKAERKPALAAAAFFVLLAGGVAARKAGTLLGSRTVERLAFRRGGSERPAPEREAAA